MKEAKVSISHDRHYDDGIATDEELVQRVLEGDKYAFELLFNRYQRELKAFVRSRVDGNVEGAEDITSEIFIKVFRFLDHYQTGSFRGWLYKIARNTVIDHHRGRRLEVPLDETQMFVSPSLPLDDQIVAAETRKELLEAMQTLSPAPRRILELRFKGYGLAEICADLGMELSAVKSAQHRAFRKLRVLLHERTNDQGGDRI